MNPFHTKHAAKVTGTLSSFDRVVFKGHLRQIAFGRGIERFLARQGLLIKDFQELAQKLSSGIDEAAQAMARKADRPCLYLRSYRTRKESLIQQIIERDNIQDGLVAVLRVVEGAQSFRVASGQGRPVIANASRKCVCVYFYFMDSRFGLVSVRIQTWLPFTVQVCVNGHEYLRRRLDAEGIGYQMIENSFWHIDDWNRAQQIAGEFAGLDWPLILSDWARLANPHLGGSLLSGQGYYWVADQAEYATDIAFTDRTSLQPLYQNLLRHAMLTFGAQDVMGFLGRKLNGQFKGELVSDLKDRWYGRRIKHRAKRNWIKMYDKQGLILRVETVINQPYEFKVRRKGKRDGKNVVAWFPLTKGVGYLYRFEEVAHKANLRYLEALSVVEDPAATRNAVREATRKVTRQGKRYGAINPAADRDLALMRAVIRGEGHLHGFTNQQIRERLYGTTKRTDQQINCLRAKTGRDLKKLQAHGLIRKIQYSRKWRVTTKGHAVISTFIKCHEIYYQEELMKIAA
jgi:hypothetical protein